MATIQIGIFSVSVIYAQVSQGTVNRTSAASVVAGPANVALGLTLKDEYGNLVSGSYTVTVKAGDWYNAIVEFIDGIASITFAVTVTGVYIDIPVAVVIV